MRHHRVSNPYRLSACDEGQANAMSAVGLEQPLRQGEVTISSPRDRCRVLKAHEHMLLDHPCDQAQSQSMP